MQVAFERRGVVAVRGDFTEALGADPCERAARHEPGDFAKSHFGLVKTPLGQGDFADIIPGFLQLGVQLDRGPVVALRSVVVLP
jgi:hypothetical protein